MSQTTPDNIPYPTGPASVGRIHTWFKNQADAVQLALNSLTSQHMEFTATKSVPSAQITLGGLFTRDNAMSTSTTIVTPGTDGKLVFNAPGVYAVTLDCESVQSIVYDQWQAVINRVVGGEIIAIGNAIPFQQRNIYITNPNVRILSPGEELKVEFYKSSTGSHTINSRIRITKIGRV